MMYLWIDVSKRLSQEGEDIIHKDDILLIKCVN